MQHLRTSFLPAFSLLLCSLFTACGGGSSSSGNSTGGSGGLGTVNYAPVIAAVSPASVMAGSATFTITITGEHFASGDYLKWGDLGLLQTTYVSANELTVSVDSGLVQSAGKLSLEVENLSSGENSADFPFAVLAAQNPPPALTSVSPASAPAGSTATTVTLTGSDFASTATAFWNDTPLTTTYKSATSLTAVIPATDLATAGDATLTVSNPAPGGGTTDGVSFAVTSTATPGATVLSLLANDLAWDPANQVIYLAISSANGTNGNTIQILDPVNASLGHSAFVGSEPDLLSVSPNSKYLYVGLGGASNLQRMTLPSLGTDITTALGSDPSFGPYYAMDVQADPIADGSVAVVRKSLTESPAEEGGVVIYDNGVARSSMLCGFSQYGCDGPPGDTYDSIQWNSDGSQMYAADMTTPDTTSTRFPSRPLVLVRSPITPACFPASMDPSISTRPPATCMTMTERSSIRPTAPSSAPSMLPA